MEFQCTLEFTGPLHVGTGEALSLATDAPVLRDVAGKIWLPGSSVRGVLADWCHREAPLLGVDPAYVRRLFGATPPRGDGSSKDHDVPDGAAADDVSGRTGPPANRDPGDVGDRQGRLTVLDVAFKGATKRPPETARADVQRQPAEEIRDHVRIDREWGAAARGGKFDHEVAHLPAGTLRLIYEGDSQEDPELLLLQSAADALEERLLAFGGKTGWGLGAVRVAATKNGSGAITWSVVDRAQPEGLSTYLNSRLPRADAAPDDPATPSVGNAAHTETASQIVDLTERHSRDRASAEAHHPGPPDLQQLRPASWLRLQLRLAFDGPMLVAALDATVSPDDPSTESRGGNAGGDERFTEERRNADATYQVDPHGEPMLAGSALRGPLRSEAERIQNTRHVHGLAETLFGTDDAQGLIRVEEGVLDGTPRHVLLNHVSIDRVTGFAATGRLFDVAALASPCFLSELLLRWDAADQKHCQAVALLFFVLRDAEQQGLWVGSRTTRGYGHAKQVKIQQATWSLVNHPNGGSPDGDAQPTRGPTTCAADIATAELAKRLGFLQKAWNSALAEASEDASPRTSRKDSESGSVD